MMFMKEISSDGVGLVRCPIGRHRLTSSVEREHRRRHLPCMVGIPLPEPDLEQVSSASALRIPGSVDFHYALDYI
jgi:hypothetical protein